MGARKRGPFRRVRLHPAIEQVRRVDVRLRFSHWPRKDRRPDREDDAA